MELSLPYIYCQKRSQLFLDLLLGERNKFRNTALVKCQCYFFQVIRERTKLISIPHVRYSDWPEYRAFEDPRTGHVVISFKLIGLKVIWDERSFVAIVLTKRHQSKVPLPLHIIQMNFNE